jgi:hypothetical protein
MSSELSLNAAKLQSGSVEGRHAIVRLLWSGNGPMQPFGLIGPNVSYLGEHMDGLGSRSWTAIEAGPLGRRLEGGKLGSDAVSRKLGEARDLPARSAGYGPDPIFRSGRIAEVEALTVEDLRDLLPAKAKPVQLAMKLHA